MSPANFAGPTHHRASSVNSGRPVQTSTNTQPNVMAGTQKGERVFPHLDDLVSVRPDLDINQPIRTILQNGELLAKQADTHLDFRRPDIAIQEYIKASIVAIEIVPHHKDYVMLQSGKGELHRLYTALTKRINAQHAKFAEVKLQIRENNERSGVKPTTKTDVLQLKTNGSHGHNRSQSVQHPPLNSVSNDSAPRQKPPIQPKPNALHGNALPASKAKDVSDLAARLASLRSGTNSVVQDPRIRTQSIPGLASSAGNGMPNSNSGTFPRPPGPREMPSIPTTLPGAVKTATNVGIPSFPRPPDAIYSPSQNADTPDAANLLSSVSRSGSFLGNSRQAAAPPISNYIPTPQVREEGDDYFSSSQDSSSAYVKASLPIVTDSATVTAEDLMTYLGYGSHKLKVLVVDVRSRDDFDTGHILTQSIICVEPITLREGISAEQLGDSMIIAPDAEQALYEQRHDFDLIVFYDQSSMTLPVKNVIGSDGALLHFSKAIVDYEYDKKLKHRPMLLEGGLDAWIDLLGPNSLKNSTPMSSQSAGAIPGLRTGRLPGRVPLAAKSQSAPLRRRRTHASRPLTKEEESRWDQTLNADSAQWIASEARRFQSAGLVYAKTTDDLLRGNKPDGPASMGDSTTFDRSPPAFDTESFTKPTPPPRSFTRQPASGLSDPNPTDISPAGKTDSLHKSVQGRHPGLTGLDNPSATCYMNSAIQAISATTFLRDFLRNFDQGSEASFVPRKGDETTKPPQLLVRSFKLLLGHLWSGTADFLKPISFARYVNSVHAGSVTDRRVRDCAYGGNLRQHDSAEFLNFLLEILDDELNRGRNLPEPKTDDPEYERNVNQDSREAAAKYAWETLTRREQSVITQNFKGLIGHITTCTHCNKESRTFNLFMYLNLTVPTTKAEQGIEKLIGEDFGIKTETITDYSCEHCKGKHEATRRDILCKLPEYLILQLNRYRYDGEGKKLQTPVGVPEYGIQVPPNSCKSEKETFMRMQGPHKYKTYAIIMHRGKNISSGHYFTVAKSFDKQTDGAGSWHRFNDAIVTKVDFDKISKEETTVIFLRRQK